MRNDEGLISFESFVHFLESILRADLRRRLLFLYRMHVAPALVTPGSVDSSHVDDEQHSHSLFHCEIEATTEKKQAERASLHSTSSGSMTGSQSTLGSLLESLPPMNQVYIDKNLFEGAPALLSFPRSNSFCSGRPCIVLLTTRRSPISSSINPSRAAAISFSNGVKSMRSRP